MTIIITISGLNVSVVISRQVLGIQCHYTELRHMGGGRTSSFTNFSSKVSRKRFQRSKSLALYLCTFVHEFMLHERKPQTLLIFTVGFFTQRWTKKRRHSALSLPPKHIWSGATKVFMLTCRRYFHLSFNLVLLYLNLVEVCMGGSK